MPPKSMAKLFSLKQQQQSTGAATPPEDPTAAPAPAPVKKKRITPAQIRLQRDMAELELSDTMQLHLPNPEDLLNFTLTLTPDEGMYHGGQFNFTFAFKATYPHDPPKVLCTAKIYHPNIDKQGNICLNILREDWKPVLSLHSIIVGLQFLFLEPNPDDPLNKEAAEALRQDKKAFTDAVRQSMRGGTVNGFKYDDVLVKPVTRKRSIKAK